MLGTFQYPACFYRTEHGYRAVFPDLGDLSVTRDYLRNLMRRGTNFPAATKTEEISAKMVGDTLNLDFENAFVDMVSVTV